MISDSLIKTDAGSDGSSESETILLKAMKAFNSGKNFVQAISLITAYVSTALVAKIRIRNRNQRLDYFTKNVGRYTRRVLECFNFELKVVGYDEKRMKGRNFLIVANHMSYIDILAISSVHPCVFVTSVDMGEQFFLGDLCELGGSIFVERRHRRAIGRDLGTIVDTLRAGHNIVLFPEGTSSNGETVLPFKKTLLLAAVEAGVDILPVCFKFTEVDGETFGPPNRDRLCWYGDMTFVPHFLGIMGLKSAKAELHFLEPIPVTKETSRHVLAEKAYRAIHAKYTGATSSGVNDRSSANAQLN